MTKLSVQLAELSDRAAKVEDVVSAAQVRDRQRLEAQRTALHSAMEKGKSRAAEAHEASQSWWAQSRDSADAWFAGVRAKAEQRKDDVDRKKAGHRADEAEFDAVDAIDFAMYALDEAESAIIDATLARADADALGA
jgi:predicted mannosyl-3-phosphoglycerate phosphatase (HAD superfamily)